MKSVILCEGTDDLWFLGYYLNKVSHWAADKKKKWGTSTIPHDVGLQEVFYMISLQSDNLLAIKSTDGQANFESSVADILHLNKKSPSSPIENLIIFRDSDDRDDDTLLREMEAWFPLGITLRNNRVSSYFMDEEYEITLHVLPLIIPFDEPGAIETLLLKAIADTGTEGEYIVEHAKEYVDETKLKLSNYLTKQRLVTKAKYSAALAITDPARSRDEFNRLMMSNPWEESASIREHMAEAVKLIDR